MRFLSWLAGLLIAVLLLVGLVITQRGGIQYQDMGMTCIVTALMFMVVGTLAYLQTMDGALPLKTPSRVGMYIIFNLALISLVIGEILFRHIEFVRSNLDSWAVTVGVPAYDSIYGYLVLVAPINLLVYLILKPYEPGVELAGFRKRFHGGDKPSVIRVLSCGALLVLASLGFVAAFSESDFTYVPSMVWAWLFASLLFFGVVGAKGITKSPDSKRT